MRMYCWGATCHGQLGLDKGPTDDAETDGPNDQSFDLISTPREVRFFRRRHVSEVACGLQHSVFLLRDGTVYTCGSNDKGQLGHDMPGRTPGQVTALETYVIRRVACGDAFTVVTAENGTVLSWGDDSCGQCGLGTEGRECKRRPRLLKQLSVHHVVQVACGGAHSIALTRGGKLFVWGDNTYGQLGLGHILQKCLERPNEITSLHGLPVMRVACGGAHSFVVSVSGTIFGWGRNHCGQLGINDTEDRSQPTLLRSLRSQKVRYIACGMNHTAVLTADGGVFTFGSAADRQLGHSSVSNEINPRKVFELMGSEVTQIACGSCHTLAFIRTSGRVFSFGLLTHEPPTGRPVYRRSLSAPIKVNGPWAEGESIRDTIGDKVPKRHEKAEESSGEPAGEEFKKVQSENDVAELDKSIFDMNSDMLAPETTYRDEDSAEDMETDSFTNYEVDTNFHRLRRGLSKRTPVGTKDETERMRVRAIFSGGNHCFLLATCAKDSSEVVDHREISVDDHIATVDAILIDTLEAAPPDEGLSEAVMSSVEEIFSSAACLNASFLKGDGAHFGSSRQNHGVDLDAAREQFSRLAGKEAVLRYMAEILGVYLIPSLPPSPPDIEALRLYLLLMESPVFTDPSPERYGTVVVQFGEALCNITSAGSKVISQWWSTLQPRHLNRILTTYKQCMMGQLSRKRSAADRPMLRRNIKICLEVLSKLCKMNNENNEILPYYLFYIKELTDNVGIRDHFLEWLQRRSGLECADVNFCDYPFVLDANAKTQLLKEDAMLQMQNAIEDVQRRNLQRILFFDIINPYLVLTINRNNIVQSTLTELSRHGSMDVKKPLKVVFVGEEGVDAGGVQKEFFMLVLREILSAKFGMFRHYPGTETIWFNSKSFEDSEMFRLVGIIVGLAIYNLTIISLPFPLALYKKLLNRPAKSLEDFKQLDPEFASNLQHLLDIEEPQDVLELYLTFAVTVESFGEVETVELKPGGADLSVTMENRQDYVDSYVDFVLNTSVEQQYRFFSEGFLHVIGGRVFNLFHPQELMDMVIGDEHYDWDEFEKNVSYKGEYYRQHPTMRMFWDVFREMSLQQKKKFLVFLTGTDRVPIQGMKTLHIIIQPVKGGEDFFPVAHTCFNLLDLPVYTDKARLRDKLLMAIENTEGFTLV
ncbi:probable E3 ubiquitin-protein ligase HERC4 [Acanthaster planci]|uniref:Probable E3 ubiquitin-protein ligase HERC4 n=1 Tax=Acanthaster planci TaxID=133434 RepID=A0A8B7Y4B8_ACAPL|nr:probable E3 ubiquitin-protein ligase HERC4 [Acanthaster planci]XP_022087392.1 probable E3 ubiquitin-protein ligase HERC4 [Acanthaster planci]XP_022087393.1 probable E3 ubiquitin-protein ligase HERC4 [Acanthaster planci]XP_022087395.1 probable E3 ubiquitin-protein ligase HERC4 [Acanthaster planci]XP_022087396.1 probable E3 ubiquitin-protein ligase HERC4 [Acanthaster planci]